MASPLHCFYFTFGQDHVKRVNGKTFDKDCVLKILATDSAKARQIMFANFGDKWAFQYDELKKVELKFYPRGLMTL